MLDYQASRTRVEQLEKARQAEKDANFESSELAVQMVGASAANMSLRAEVALLEDSLVSSVEEGRTMLMRLHASATERAAQHRKQLDMWGRAPPYSSTQGRLRARSGPHAGER